MRTILITAACLIAGVHHDPGDVAILPVQDADSVVSGGKGRQVPDGSKPEDFADDGTSIENRDPVPENRDQVTTLKRTPAGSKPAPTAKVDPPPAAPAGEPEKKDDTPPTA